MRVAKHDDQRNATLTGAFAASRRAHLPLGLLVTLGGGHVVGGIAVGSIEDLGIRKAQFSGHAVERRSGRQTAQSASAPQVQILAGDAESVSSSSNLRFRQHVLDSLRIKFARTHRYGGASTTRRVSSIELPAELSSVIENFKLVMPLAELEALSVNDADTDPQTQLPGFWLQRYRDLADEGRAPQISMYIANHTAVVVPRTYLRGLLDRIKTVALGLALDIEDVSREAGDSGGPTVNTEPALREAVASHMTMIFASNSTVAVASGAGAFAVQLQAGDRDGLLAAARSILDERGVEDLDAALSDDGGEPGSATRGFLDRVRSGSYSLAGGLAVNGAYDGLVTLLGQAFPGFG